VSAKLATGSGSLRGDKTGMVQQSSRLFSSLFVDVDPKRRLNVFEAGAAISETVEFFSQYKTRIHIAGLYSEPLVVDQQKELSEQEMKLEFQKLFGFKVGTLIDVCLFWDFLNYLSRPALRAFSAALKPYVHAGTMAHGFSVLNVETPLRNQQYGISALDTLCVRRNKAAQLEYYPHSHEELNESLHCFKIGRGWLLPDGRLEILLNAVL
jgi:hypothetical protein